MLKEKINNSIDSNDSDAINDIVKLIADLTETTEFNEKKVNLNTFALKLY